MSHSPAPVSPAAGPAAAAPGTTRHGLPDDATVEAFLRDGTVVLRGVLDAGALAVLERGIEVNLAAPSPFGLFASLPDDPGRFFEDFRCWQRIPVYEAILHDCALPAIAAQQMRRGEAARVTRVKVPKAAEARSRTGLSQEQFARLLGVSARTLQDWEQGRREPTGAAKTLLRVAYEHPEVLLKLER